MALDNMDGLRCSVFVIAVLWFKMLVTGLITAGVRRRAGTLRTPEDVKLGGAATPGEAAGLTGGSGDDASPAEKRWRRIHTNDMENIPMACVIFILANMAFVSPGLQVSMSVIFMGLRILHTLFYAGGAQPWRTVVYSLSTLCMLILVIATISEVFKTKTPAMVIH